MKITEKVVDLHPTDNHGEKTHAHVLFDVEGRIMTLKLESVSYGNSSHDVRINFKSPDQMIELAKALKEIAYVAKDEFRRNP